jgi:hypothetical protein
MEGGKIEKSKEEKMKKKTSKIKGGKNEKKTSPVGNINRD